jgi:hypothetical protein
MVLIQPKRRQTAKVLTEIPLPKQATMVLFIPSFPYTFVSGKKKTGQKTIRRGYF